PRAKAANSSVIRSSPTSAGPACSAVLVPHKPRSFPVGAWRPFAPLVLPPVIVSPACPGKAKNHVPRNFVHLFKNRMKIVISRAKLCQSGGFCTRSHTPGRMTGAVCRTGFAALRDTTDREHGNQMKRIVIGAAAALAFAATSALAADPAVIY